MEVWGFVPLIRQRARYGCPSLKEYLEPGFVIREIGQTYYDLSAHSQCVRQHRIRMLYLLEALVQDNVIERFVFVFRETAVYVAMYYVQTLGHARVYSLVVYLEALTAYASFLNEKR